MEEYFDVLNNKGQYTGRTESREKCHKEGLWHKAVAVFVINSKGQVLLQRRSPNKKMWPNMWDMTAGGHVLSGEFGFQSIIRECKEEIGIILDKRDITFIGCSISTNIKGDIINNHFNEYYIAKKEIDLKENEIEEFKKLILSLGKSEVEYQERLIDLTVENLKKLTVESKEDIKNKGNLYKKLITFSGICIGIILI